MYIVRTSIDDYSRAKRIAKIMVENMLAASVHIRQIDSVYRWNNDVVNETEYEIEIICENYEAVYNKIKTLHPYELPEFIIFRNVESTKAFSYWVDCNCKEEK